MDPISHAVVGAAIAAVAPEAAPAVMAATITGAVIPDSDYVVRLVRGPGHYLRHHRGVTHSPPVLTAFALVIGAAARLLFARGPGFWPLVGWSALGLLSHVLLDCTNNYGTQALWPFVRRRIHWDWTFIVDVQLLGIIAAAALVNLLLPGRRRLVFAVALALAGAYMWLRARVHDQLRRAVRKRFGIQAEAYVNPGMIGLNNWRYIVHDGDRWLSGGISWLPLRLAEPWVVADQDGPAIAAARLSPMARHFLSWAQLVRAEQKGATEGGYTVRFTDMRFDFRDFAAFGCIVTLDPSLRVVGDELLRGAPSAGIDRRAMLREMLERVRPD